MTRRNGIRTVLVLLLVGLGVVLFALGKEHQVFLDNKALAVGGAEVPALEAVRVTVDGGEPLEFAADDRDVVQTRGLRAQVKLEVLDGNGNVTKTVERSVSFSFEDRVMLSLPVLVQGGEGYRLPPPVVE
ncbi:DUF6672 family protein [Aminomonas paucivorans]|uniref:DUF6672 family protein n=1 Tax=Aminomonas paucivorans TaxID=81412 RepID=UPI0033309CBF